jgi:hypothetical protein
MTLRLFGLSLFTRDSGGGLVLLSYHPHTSPTWYWSIYLDKINPEANFVVARDPNRHGQWHDHYRLPFRRKLTVSFQDYHKQGGDLKNSGPGVA